MPSPLSWSNTTYVSLSYSQNIDALLGGTRWASSTITYSFPGYDSIWSTSNATGYGPSSGDGEPWSVYSDILSTSDRNYFAAALQKWADISNLQFSFVADTSTSVGDIRAAYTSLSSGTQAHAYYPDNSSVAGDVWINSGGSSAALYWTLGSYENFAVLHELGHALGLKHPFYQAEIISTILPSSLDTQSYTIMSYSAQPGDSTTYFSYYPTTPMILDIQAIQYVYGANNSYHAGNNTYSYSDATTYHETIWDAGGTDTIQYSGILNSAIDLRAGYSSKIGRDVYVQNAYGANLQAENNVWIAYNVTIENAIGGSGNDILTGNNTNNNLDGGAGNDTMNGGAGIDTATYTGNRANFTVTASGTSFTVTNTTGTEGVDTLDNIERLVFGDTKIALDVVGGNAGTAAKILGATLGAAHATTPIYVGIILGYLDGGTSYADMMGAVLNAIGKTTPTAAATLLLTNILDAAPSADLVATYASLIDSGAYSVGSFGVLAADYNADNTAHINLVGLARTGIEFV